MASSQTVNICVEKIAYAPVTAKTMHDSDTNDDNDDLESVTLYIQY